MTEFVATTKLEQSLAQLTEDKDDVERRIAVTTAQRDEASAALDKPTVSELQEQLSELNRELDGAVGGLALLERQHKDTLELEGMAAAQERCEAIAHIEHPEAVEKYELAAEAMVTYAIGFEKMRLAVIAAHERCGALRQELLAGVDRFRVKVQVPATVPVPLRHPVLVGQMPFATDHKWPATGARRREQVEKDDTGMRTRRTFGEISGTPTHAIIERAGLRPFVALTERQQQLVKERERAAVAEAESARRFEVEVAAVPTKRSATDPLGRA